MPFTVDSLQNAINSTTAGVTFTINKFRLNLLICEFNEYKSKTIKTTFNNSFSIPCVSIAGYQNSFISTANTTFQWTINVKFANARDILFSFRPPTTQITKLYSLSGRTSYKMTNVVLYIGDRHYPSNKVITWDYSQTQASGVNFPALYTGTMKYFGLTIDYNVNTCVDMAY